MSDKLKVLVTGATGQQGGATTRALLERGHAVRAMTRAVDGTRAEALRELGAEVVFGDFNHDGSLARAMEGVDALFAMGSSREGGVDTEVRQGRALIHAAREARVRHVVYSSVASADQDTGLPHFDSKLQVEEALRQADVPFTVLAPVSFMENLFAPHSVEGLRAGTLALALPEDRPLQLVAVSDVGRFAAHVIDVRDRFLGGRVELASDELTGPRMAELLGAALGREIRYQALAPAALAGVGEELAGTFRWLDAVGHQVPIQHLRRDHMEGGWHSFASWLEVTDLSILK